MKLTVFLFLLVTINSISEIFAHKENVILSRKKRFLVFPKGSNLVMTISGIKEILLNVPRGFRTTIECDLSFKLPDKSFRSYVRDSSLHIRHRREIFDELSKAFNMFELNSKACIRRTMCDVLILEKYQENSLIYQLLLAIFKYPNSSENMENYCSNANSECRISFLGLILNHI